MLRKAVPEVKEGRKEASHDSSSLADSSWQWQDLRRARSGSGGGSGGGGGGGDGGGGGGQMVEEVVVLVNPPAQRQVRARLATVRRV